MVSILLSCDFKPRSLVFNDLVHSFVRTIFRVLFCLFQSTSITRTPKGQTQISEKWRPYYRSRVSMNFGIVRIKITVIER